MWIRAWKKQRPEETVTGSESVDGTEIMDETPAGSTLEDVFGADGLEVAYGGVSLAGNYTESDVLDVRASNGKQFMVLDNRYDQSYRRGYYSG